MLYRTGKRHNYGGSAGGSEKTLITYLMLKFLQNLFCKIFNYSNGRQKY